MTKDTVDTQLDKFIEDWVAGGKELAAQPKEELKALMLSILVECLGEKESEMGIAAELYKGQSHDLATAERARNQLRQSAIDKLREALK